MRVPLRLLTGEEQDLLVGHGVPDWNDVPSFAERLCELFLDRIVGGEQTQNPRTAYDPGNGD